MLKWILWKIEEYKIKQALREQMLEEELFQQNLKNLWQRPENKDEQ